MRAFIAAILLLFAGCGYKSVTLYLPTSSYNNSDPYIAVSEPINPVIGEIAGEKAKIKIASDVGSYIRAKLLKHRKKFQGYQIRLDIERVYMLYDPQKKRNNLYGIVIVNVTLKKRGSFLQKKLIVEGVETVREVGYEERLKEFLQKLLDETARQIVELV